MRFKAAVKKIEKLINYEIKPAYDYKLDNYRDFLFRMGSPQENLKSVILIAGTKGKGSTGIILSSILSAAGKKVGFFSSPHLIDVRERIRINNRKIKKRRFVELVKTVLPKMDSPHGIRSYFEALVTIATIYFFEKGTDYAIFEVGMGGRKDATNVFQSNMSIITRIGHDHQRFLGKNLITIAQEKAGIIHDCTTVVLARQKPRVKNLVKEISQERNSTFYYAEENIGVEILNQDYLGSHLLIKMDGKLLATEFSPLGEHQIENLKTAVQAAKHLSVKEDHIKEGLRKAIIPARVQVIDSKPRIILDVAHNPQSFNALAKVLPRLITGRLFVIFGISKGKDWTVLRKKILPWAYQTIITRAKLQRAKEPELLRKLYTGVVKDSVIEAISSVLEDSSSADTILITGSFFVVGEAMETLNALGFRIQKP